MLYRLLLAYRVIRTTFGQWISPLFTFALFVNLRISVAIGMALDHVFFPRLRRTEVKRPIVIAGNPRTGTTFLQRFMTDQGLGTGSRLWSMLFPSLTLQFFLRPFIPLLEKVSPAKDHAAAAHEVKLDSVETDDPSMFFRFFDGFFLFGFLAAWAEEDLVDYFDPRKRDYSARDFAWLRQTWRRNLVTSDADRMVAKLFSVGPRVQPFLKEFPDAKLLYMVRDPVAFVPSGMSLLTGVLDAKFGYWKLPEEERARYVERLYQGFLRLAEVFHEDWQAGRIPRDRVMIVHFERLMQDFEGLMDDILAFVDHEPDQALLEEIQRVGEKQRAYKSKHKYDLARFGLDEARIRRDYAFIYDSFAYQPEER